MRPAAHTLLAVTWLSMYASRPTIPVCGIHCHIPRHRPKHTALTTRIGVNVSNSYSMRRPWWITLKTVTASGRDQAVQSLASANNATSLRARGLCKPCPCRLSCSAAALNKYILHHTSYQCKWFYTLVMSRRGRRGALARLEAGHEASTAYSECPFPSDTYSPTVHSSRPITSAQ